MNKITKIINDPMILYNYLKKYVSLYTYHQLRNIYTLKYKGLKVKYTTEDLDSKKFFLCRLRNKVHEPVMTEMLMREIKGKNFADVGAHLGYFTCLCAKALPNNKVYSFEMDDKASERILKSIALNNLSNVELVVAAVSDKEGEVYIEDEPHITSGLSILPNPNNQKCIKSNAISLDIYFRNKDKPEVLKIDVEGAEMDVLKGMEELLKEDLILFLELHGDFLPKFNTSSIELFNYLIDRGYNIYEIQNHRGKEDQKYPLKSIKRTDNIEYNTMLYITKK